MPTQRLWFRYDLRSFTDQAMKKLIIEGYEKGNCTTAEYRAAKIEWSTDHIGRKFYYECPKCGHPMRHCPDPECVKEKVGHHLFEEYNFFGEHPQEECKEEDISYKTANRVYFPVQTGTQILTSEIKYPEEWWKELEEWWARE